MTLCHILAIPKGLGKYILMEQELSQQIWEKIALVF